MSESSKSDSKLTFSVKASVTMGTALAMILSYSANTSILWAIMHGVCSWFYVIYFAIVK